MNASTALPRWADLVLLPREDFEVLVEEASKKSLCDLLSERGFGPILRALPSLAARFGTLPTRI